jgi:hypothetical protein
MIAKVSRIKFAALLVASFFSVNLSAQDKPQLSQIDRIRLTEAFRLSDSLGNRLWKDWDKAPFAVLLVTPDYEFLIRHPQPTKDFVALGYDAKLKSDVYYRKRTLPVNLLATFPVIGLPSTIVVGQAENTFVKTSTPWVVTILHEHFHQLQNSQSNYYADVNALNLSHGDQTGMWMLNYAFPYQKEEVKEQFSKLSKMLLNLNLMNHENEFDAELANYLKERHRLKAMLNSDDYKYLSFQLWQEGIARYTEYRMAMLAAAKYKPTRVFRALKDYTPFAKAAADTRARIFKSLAEIKLDELQREAFYPFGAGEGLLLDRANPHWQERYFVEKFNVENYFKSNW